MLSQEYWLNWHPRLLMAVLLPLSYAAGYLQSWVIDKVEAKMALCSTSTRTEGDT
jgi:hypothetical protein